jgi:hypothetical protein
MGKNVLCSSGGQLDDFRVLHFRRLLGQEPCHQGNCTVATLLIASVKLSQRELHQ